jgi:hypothetical protein
MLKSYFFLSLLLLSISSQSLFSQSQAVDAGFSGVKSQGEIPDDFITSWAEKYSKRLKEEIANGNSGRDLNRLDEFWLSQHHAIDELLNSGKLSFGDPVSNYLNDIADVILADDPELRDQIRIYYYHSPGVNAFTVADGIIAVYTGLLAHVKSEAELAFVLAHEIAHYKKEHMFASYEEALKNQSSGWFTVSLNPMARFEKFVDRRKEQEEEADLVGLELFLKTNYSIDAVDTVLTTLHESYIPYGRTRVLGNPLAITEPAFNIPAVYFRDEIDSIKRDEDYQDDAQTHPNIGSRRRNLEAQFVQLNTGNQPRQKFIVSEERFQELQELARFEQIRERLLLGDFTTALYDVYVLEKKYPKNDFLAISKIKALYGLASFKAIDEISMVSPSPTSLEGPSQQMAHIIKQFNREQLISLALYTTLEGEKKYPEKKFLKQYSKVLSRYLFAYADADPEDFLMEEDQQPAFDKTEADFSSARSFYRAEQRHYRDFHRYLLAPYARAGYLEDQLVKNKTYLDSIAEDKVMPRDERRRRSKDREDYLDEFGTDFNIRNVIVLDPVLKVRNIGDDLDEKLDALEQELAYKEQLPNLFREVGIEPELLYVENMAKTDVERYNQFCNLEEWVSEASSYGRFDLLPTSLDIANNIKLETKFVCRIVGMIDDQGTDHYYFGLFNLKTGELVYSRYESVGRTLSMRDLEKETLTDLTRIYN